MAPTENTKKARVNIEESRWDQNTYWGRAKHFFVITNPLNLLCSTEVLEHSRDIVTRYRKGEDIPGLTEDQLWKAKHIYDSAFHPETGEKMILFGRMSAQVPSNMAITGSMLTFYKTRKEVIFLQWFNQSFNAVVNYCNRAGSSPISVPTLAISYTLATSGAVITALAFGVLAKKAPPLIKRFVPFTAVAAGNCINLPIMRSQELIDGCPVYDINGKQVGSSAIAARDGIAQVVFSRISIAVPPMTFPPIVVNWLERKGTLRRFPKMENPTQVLLVGFCLLFATPLCCALFPQKSSISVRRLEPEIQERLKKLPNPPTILYYNKGL